MNKIKSWIKASRLQSQSYLFLPLLLGQILAMHTGHQFNWWLFALVHLYGLFMQLYIVYANDYADAETDKLNSTFNVFSGGSRVIPEGRLTSKEVGTGAIIMATLTTCIGIVGALFFDRILMIPLAIVSLLLLWMYSYKPLRLSYRGGGEFLQMTGVGLVLPLMGYYGQSGEIMSFPWLLFAILLPTNLASGMTTSLPDEPSDRAFGKRTTSVMFGTGTNKVIIIFLNAMSIAALISIALYSPLLPFSWLFLLPPVLLIGQLPFLANRPGSKGLNLFVALSVGSTLTITTVMILAF